MIMTSMNLNAILVYDLRRFRLESSLVGCSLLHSKRVGGEVTKYMEVICSAEPDKDG